MRTEGIVSLVTGAASGLGLATARALLRRGAHVVLCDREEDAGLAAVADLQAESRSAIRFVRTDVTDPAAVAGAVAAARSLGTLRIVVHCAGGGGPVRVLSPEGAATPLEAFRRIIDLNLVSTFDVVRQTSEAMAGNSLLDEDRGVIVLTSSIAAFEGQSAQLAYAAAKAGIVGLTLPAARDLSRHAIRVCTIAPGMFDTGMLTGLSEETRSLMATAVPHPGRLGRAEEFAMLAMAIIENGMLNGECIRLDGAMRLAGVDTLWGTQLTQPIPNP